MAAGLETSSKYESNFTYTKKSDKGSHGSYKGEDKEDMEAVEYFKYKNTLKPMILDIYKEIERKTILWL